MTEPDALPPAPEAPKFEPLPGTPLHKSDLSTRFAVGVALIGIALIAIWFGDWPLRILVLIGAGLMFAEWAEMHKTPWLWIWIGVAFLAALLLGGMQYVFPVGQVDAIGLDTGEEFAAIDWGSFRPFLYLVAAAVGVGAVLALLARRFSLGWGFVYIGVPAASLLVLGWADVTLVLWVMVVTWSTDIGAFFFGRAIGGPKLAPRISPNKTWAGLIGGMIVAGALGWVTAHYLGFADVTAIDDETGEEAASALYMTFFWLGAPMAVVAQVGDLYESAVKRRLGYKDSGNILPGHGGVLDRCDGLLAVSFCTLAYIMIWLQFA